MKKKKADIIPTAHLCEVREEGYYWARLVVWEPPTHLPQKRDFPMLCDPCPVELFFSSAGSPLIVSPLSRRERVQDWLFMQRIPDPLPIERHGVLLHEYAPLLNGPRSPKK